MFLLFDAWLFIHYFFDDGFERDFIITLLPIGLIIRIIVSLNVAVHSELLHLVWVQLSLLPLSWWVSASVVTRHQSRVTG